MLGTQPRRLLDAMIYPERRQRHGGRCHRHPAHGAENVAPAGRTNAPVHENTHDHDLDTTGNYRGQRDAGVFHRPHENQHQRHVQRGAGQTDFYRCFHILLGVKDGDQHFQQAEHDQAGCITLDSQRGHIGRKGGKSTAFIDQPDNGFGQYEHSRGNWQHDKHQLAQRVV